MDLLLNNHMGSNTSPFFITKTSSFLVENSTRHYTDFPKNMWLLQLSFGSSQSFSPLLLLFFLLLLLPILVIFLLFISSNFLYLVLLYTLILSSCYLLKPITYSLLIFPSPSTSPHTQPPLLILPRPLSFCYAVSLKNNKIPHGWHLSSMSSTLELPPKLLT